MAAAPIRARHVVVGSLCVLDTTARLFTDADREKLTELANAVTERLCELSPRAVQGMKESMVRGAALDYAALDHITNLVQTRVMNSEDRKLGGRVFNDRGTADWPD